MAVHNGASFVQKAVESVLNQTLPAFEFIIMDDGSTDETPEILSRCADPRLRVVRQRNSGQLAALNRGLELATGEYIARQDADDVWLPGRLAWQVLFLERHVSVGAVGAQAVMIDSADRPFAVTRLPTRPISLRWQLLFESPFVHCAVLLRRAVLASTGPYRTDDEVGPVADYELWSRVSRSAGIANAPFPLVMYREHAAAMTKREADAFASKAPSVREANVENEFGDHGLAVRAARSARTLRLEQASAMSLPAIEDAVDTLLELEHAFLQKHQNGLARDPFAVSEIREFTATRLLVAASRVGLRLTSAPARKVARTLLRHVLELARTSGGVGRATGLAWETLLRLSLGSDAYHIRAARRALRRALGHPVNRCSARG